ncbi:MAG TPA: hypothetical protein VGP44_05130 [Gemmatimonadales bacterium]|nr:hypothetical protein [Gemmatimonadales bacterium]
MIYRDTWPERYFSMMQQDIPGLWPGSWAKLLELCGGTLPPSLTALAKSPFGGWADDQLEGLMLQGRKSGKPLPRDRVEMFYAQQFRYMYHMTWWLHEGTRVYVLDETTTLALLHTTVDDFPVSEFRMPARSFFLRVPDGLGWQVDLPRIEGWTDTELEQKLDGFQLTLETEPDGTPAQLQVLLVGRGSTPQEDNVQWYDLTLHGKATLGDVITQRLGSSMREWEQYVNRDVLRLIFGAVLYITSNNPLLTPIPPLPRPTVKRKGSGKRAWNQYESATHHPVIYVGGASQGFVKGQTRSTGHGELLRKPPKPHKRDGHFRMQAVGPRAEGQHERIWIQPQEIGDWDRVLAWETARAMRVVERRTRPALPTEEVR